MGRHQEIELEIRRQAIRLEPKAAALFELPRLVYAKIVEDNATRKKPFKIGYARVQKVIRSMAEFQ